MREAPSLESPFYLKRGEKLFSISLDNYNCKIRITSLNLSSTYNTIDYGLLSTPIIYDDYGLISSAESRTEDFSVDIGGATHLTIQRKESDESTWLTILTKTITSDSDLSYVYIDKYTRSRRTYDYRFTLYAGDTIMYIFDDTIKCSFDAISVSDESDEFILDLNLDFDYDNNQKIIYQDLLQSKYPRQIRNGLSDYDTGYVEGLPLLRDSKGHYTTDFAHKYKQSYVSFLKNGLEKTIKTYKGDIWVVSVNAGVKVNQGDYEGAESVRFNWTQIADSPEYAS